ncbi:MAG TPA: TetR/AcrR family transcriptional regulator [Aeromicrobium sp.]|nr:TetR/AcrR family transcriptional regulator [Aeromicrobium sp.]
MTQDTRTRMINGAALLVGTRGAKSASLRELAREAGVPLGSTYHHFPEGKRQLVEEAVATAGDRIDRLISRAQEQGPDAAIDAFANGWRSVLESTDFRSGCPVLAVALEDDPVLRETATSIFDRWRVSMAEAFIEGGVPRERAPRLARMVVASIEGAIALCRAEHSFDPLEDVLAELRVTLAEAGGMTRGR